MQQYQNLPNRHDFFSRVQFPNFEPKRLQHYALRSGIHPEGIILNQPFYGFPFRINLTKIIPEIQTLVSLGKIEFSSVVENSEKMIMVGRQSMKKLLRGTII